jgi:hypothetical protein
MPFFGDLLVQLTNGVPCMNACDIFCYGFSYMKGNLMKKKIKIDDETMNRGTFRGLSLHETILFNFLFIPFLYIFVPFYRL